MGRLLCLLSFAFAASVHATSVQEPLDRVIDRALARAGDQYDYLLEQIGARPGLPRTFEHGKLVLTERDWTVGFFPGSLWYLYEATNDPKWRAAAEKFTPRVAGYQHHRGTHDLGFILSCSYGQGLRLTGNPAYRDVLLNGARALASRFNPRVGATKSWDWAEHWQFPVIIDNLMNLELLLWAARAAPEPAWREMAVRHADTTLKNHFRPDGSTYHVVDYDPHTGAVRTRVTHQGAADESAWARGQAWAIYGFTVLYRETRAPRYLEQARRTADFVIDHPRLPHDTIPYWDFDAPGIPDAPRDASAAAVMASALLELSTYLGTDGERYRDFALRQVRALASATYLADVGENGGFILRHSTGNFPRNSEVDTPLNYADYYFLEALLRARRGSNLE